MGMKIPCLILVHDLDKPLKLEYSIFVREKIVLNSYFSCI